ncbi:cation:proton antiporter, partial [bacterium]|nr:cation:proton antiporter [bacterium]
LLGALPLALVLGGIASATAPAATVAVIRELKAKGPFTTMLLAIVAIDDAIALLIFAFGLTIAEALLAAGPEGTVFVWLGPLMEIVGSLLLGLLVGIAHHLVAGRIKRELETMTVSLGIITFASGLSMLLGISPLLTIMVAGFVLVNLSRRNQRVFASVERIQGPIFIVFFTLAGTQLHLENLLTCGIIGSAFLIFRFVGKVGGAHLGALSANVRGAARRYLGLALLPQAGVAIGLMLVAQESSQFSMFRGILVDVVLASVALNELIGPPLTAIALKRAGDVPLDRARGSSIGKDLEK